MNWFFEKFLLFFDSKDEVKGINVIFGKGDIAIGTVDYLVVALLFPFLIVQDGQFEFVDRSDEIEVDIFFLI